MNHPNSFADPILFTLLTHPLRPKFMARGDAFKPGFASWFFDQLGIVPIFRMQDGGKEGLLKNDATYQKVNHYLKANKQVIIFAEGLCVLERRLRPLKKGVPRMVFGAYEQLAHGNLQIVPVGVNYSTPDKFGAEVFIQVGQPIAVKDYWEAYQEQPAKTMNRLLQDLEPKMRELITHINNKADDEAVLQAEILLKPALLSAKGFAQPTLEQDFEALREITAKMNAASSEQTEEFQRFKSLSRAYFSALNQAHLRDWLIDPAHRSNGSKDLVWRCVKLLLVAPFLVSGFLLNALPFYLTPLLTNKIIKSREFYTSIALGISMVLFLLWYIVLYALAAITFPDRLWPALIWLLAGITGAVARKTMFLPKKIIAQIRLVFSPSLYRKLLLQRAELLQVLNKF